MSEEITQNTSKNKKEEIAKKRDETIKITTIKIVAIVGIFLFFNLTIDLEILPFWLSTLITLIAMFCVSSLDVTVEKLEDEISELEKNDN